MQKLVGIWLGLMLWSAALSAADHEALGVEASNCPATSRRDQHASYQACQGRRDGEHCGTLTTLAKTPGLLTPQAEDLGLHCITQFDTRLNRSYPCCAARLVVDQQGTKRYLPVDFTQFEAQFFD